MKSLGSAFILAALLTGSVAQAQSNSMTVVLKKAEVSENIDEIQWLVVLTNSSPAAIRFSHFSLASAIRATKFTDGAGYAWRVIRPKEVIDPPSPEVDFRLLVPARSAVSLTIQTEGFEAIPKDNGVATTNRIPERLSYKFERDVEIVDDISKRSSWWKCSGSGIVEIKWPSKK
jgi:hypothetical protein